MKEAAKTPGALGFSTFCTLCMKHVQVRSDGEYFRVEPHVIPSLPAVRCASSETKWEPA